MEFKDDPASRLRMEFKDDPASRLRNWYAGLAMQALIAKPPKPDRTHNVEDVVSEMAFKYADAMICASKKES